MESADGGLFVVCGLVAVSKYSVEAGMFFPVSGLCAVTKLSRTKKVFERFGVVRTGMEGLSTTEIGVFTGVSLVMGRIGP